MKLDYARPQTRREIQDSGTAPPLAMRLYVMDAWVRDAAVLVGADGIAATLRSAAEAGGVTVLGETNSCRDLTHDPALFGGHRMARSRHLTSAWCACSLSRMIRMTCSPSMSPYVRRSTLATSSSGQV